MTAYTWTPGAPLSAENLNKVNAATQAAIDEAKAVAMGNSYNILQLYMQNYIDGKEPNYNGIWYDTFTDNTKAVLPEATLASAASAQKVVTMPGQKFVPVAGMPLTIYDATNVENVVVASVAESANVIAYKETALFTDDFANGNSKGWTGDMTFGGGVMKNDTTGTQRHGYQAVDLMPYLLNANNTGVKITGKFMNTYYYYGNQSYSIYPFYVDSSNDAYIYIQAGAAGYNTITIYDRDGGSAGSGSYSTEAVAAGEWLNFEILAKRGSSGNYWANIEVRVWKTTSSRPTTAQATSANVYLGNSTNTRKIDFSAYTHTSGGGLANFDDITITQGVPAKDVTMVANLANTYAAGSQIGRTTATFDTDNARIDASGYFGDTYSTTLEDTFNRTDSSTVGNGWSENEASAAYVAIFSNQLKLYNTGSNYASVYRTGQTRGVKLTITGIKYNTGGAYTNHYVELTTKGDGTVGSGLGVRFKVPVSTSNPANTTFELVDKGAVLATTTLQRYYDDYHTVELIIHDDYSMEARTWLDSGSRPAAADLTSAARTPNASGTKTMIGASFYAGWDIFVSNFKEESLPQYLTTATTLRYLSEVARFMQAKSKVELWFTRNTEVRKNPKSAPSGTTIVIDGNQTGTFAANDTIELVTADYATRERKTISTIAANDITPGTAKSLLTANTGSKYFYRSMSGGNPLYISNIYSATKTFAFSMKTSDYRASEGVMDVGAGPNGYGLTLRWHPTDTGKLQLRIIWNNSSSYEATVSSLAAVNDGAKHHIAFTVNSGGIIQLYVDGVLQGTATPPSTTSGTCSSYYWGRTSYGSVVSDIYFDDITAWGTVLSATQIAALIGANHTGTEGMQALWKLDSNLNDSTANAQTLTQSGTPTYQNPINTIYETQITTGTAIAGTFTTSDFVERVAVLPQVSLVGIDDAEALEAPTYVTSIVDLETGEVEDEYTYTPTTAGNDLTIALEITRHNTTENPYIKRLATALIN